MTELSEIYRRSEGCADSCIEETTSESLDGYLTPRDRK